MIEINRNEEMVLFYIDQYQSQVRSAWPQTKTENFYNLTRIADTPFYWDDMHLS